MLTQRYGDRVSTASRGGCINISATTPAWVAQGRAGGRGRSRARKRNDGEPVDTVACDIPGFGIARPVVERPPVIGHLGGPVVRPDEGRERSRDLGGSGDRAARCDRTRRPRLEACARARRVRCTVALVDIEGPARRPDEDQPIGRRVQDRQGERGRSGGPRWPTLRRSCYRPHSLPPSRWPCQADWSLLHPRSRLPGAPPRRRPSHRSDVAPC